MIQVYQHGPLSLKLMQAFDDRKLGFADCAADFRSACRSCLPTLPESISLMLACMDRSFAVPLSAYPSMAAAVGGLLYNAARLIYLL